MFPGLGDHYLDMGAELYRTLPRFKREVDLCAEVLKPEIGIDIRDVIYPRRHQEGGSTLASAPKELDLRKMLGRDRRQPNENEKLLNRTSVAQPALFVVEYALSKVLEGWGLSPTVMIGYSLGEYVAACLAGVLSLSDSLSFVARRAQLFETLPAGAMLAVSLSEEQVLPLLGRHVSIAAVNGSELCVVAGPPEEIDAFEKELANRAVTIRRVQTSHAFHSPMMAPIADEVTAIARSYPRKAPSIPFVSNVTGRLMTAAEATDPAYWAEHLRSPVRFGDGLRTLASRSELAFVESGPGQTLSSIAIALPTVGEGHARVVVPTMRAAYDPQRDTAVLLKAFGRLWVSGVGFDDARLPSQPLVVPSEINDGSSDTARAAATAETAPATPTERELAEIWSEIFRGKSISPSKTFFELGGNSLSATRLIQHIGKRLQVKLPLRRIYEAPTLQGMAAAIDAVRSNGKGAPPTPPAIPKPPAGAHPRIHLPNGLVISHQNEAETRHFYEDIFEHRSYVRHGIRIRDGACVFDVGANVGLFTLFAHREAKDVRVFSFEPAPPTFEVLSANVREHGVRATVLNHGLSNAEREAEFTFYPRSSGMSSFHADEDEERHNLKTIIANQRRTGGEAVESADEEELLDVRFEATPFTARLRRLSDVIRAHRVDHVDLMKIDVQKCELEVIEGIDEEDWPKISQIVLEAHDTEGRVAALRSRMEQRGYAVTVQQDDLYVGTNIYNLYAVRGGL
ncbi:MAG TPA: FkbM family methyltransferase [Labilithrix sp.]|nr:FkbM family methyltransferase [Labilithrix sp.]